MQDNVNFDSKIMFVVTEWVKILSCFFGTRFRIRMSRLMCLIKWKRFFSEIISFSIKTLLTFGRREDLQMLVIFLVLKYVKSPVKKLAAPPTPNVTFS